MEQQIEVYFVGGANGFMTAKELVEAIARLTQLGLAPTVTDGDVVNLFETVDIEEMEEMEDGE